MYEYGDMCTNVVPMLCDTMLTNHLSSVIVCLLEGRWDAHGDKYNKFIGHMGTIAVVPGQPHNWYPLIKKELKSVWYCCEHGVDWWFSPKRGISRRTGMVYCGVDITITSETMQMLHRRKPQRVRQVKNCNNLIAFLSSARTT
tara:strand:+ start:1782 stop:2210 length:429 start_codon:yes stop_codon:yes gene_type:complete